MAIVMVMEEFAWVKIPNPMLLLKRMLFQKKKRVSLGSFRKQKVCAQWRRDWDQGEVFEAWQGDKRLASI